MIDRWHSPGPTHPIRAARYPPRPRLGPPNLTQGGQQQSKFQLKWKMPLIEAE